MFTARELRGTGASVTLLERGRAAMESSWAGGGILSPLYPWQQPDPVTELVRWSQIQYRKIADTLQDETAFNPELIQCGMLVLDAINESEVSRWADRFNIAVEMVDADWVHQHEPALKTGKTERLLLPDVAQVRTPRLGKAMRDSLLMTGVDVREHCEVRCVRHDQGRVRGVETRDGFVAAEHVVVAGGAWSGELLAPLGIVIPVQPVRGQMILIHGGPGLLSRILLKEGRYLIPRRDGRVLAGSTIEDVGFDNGVTGEAGKELYQFAVELVPDLADYGIEHQWAGLRPGMPGPMPLIGPCPGIRGLWANTGHFRNGVVMAPASARILADLLAGRPSFTDHIPFALANHVDPGLNVV